MEKTLASLMVELDGTTAPLDRVMDNAVTRAQRGGNRAGGAFAAGFATPILNRISSINSLLAGVQTGVNFAVGVSGMESAAQLGDYRRALVGIAGDAKKAETAFKAFQKIAGDSNFDTSQVFEFGIARAGKTGDVVQAVKDTQNLLDASTVFGVSNAKFGQYQNNISEISRRGDKKVEVPDVTQLVNAAPLLNAKIAQAYGITASEADKRVHDATGNQLLEMIRTVGNKNQGAAARAGATDPFKVASNLKDDAGNAMAPTGDLLNKAVTPFLSNVREVAGGVGQLNELSHGWLGLVAVLGLGTAGVLRFGGTAKTTWNITTGLTGALRDLAAAEEGATLATRSAASAARQKATAEEQEALASRFGARQLAFPFFGAPGAAAAEGAAAQTFRDRLRGFGKTVSPLAPYGLGLGLELLGSGVKGDDKSPLWQRETGTALQDIGTGVGFGAPFGWVGVGVGALIGAAGAIYHVATDLKAEREKGKNGGSSNDLKDAASSLKSAAGNFEKISGRVYGGGARAAASVNAIERDYILAHMNGVK